MSFYRSCISGQEFSTKPTQPDARNYRYRATDILISFGGPEAEIKSVLEKAKIPFKVLLFISHCIFLMIFFNYRDIKNLMKMKSRKVDIMHTKYIQASIALIHV